jgi:hypothetical protein
MLCFFFAVNFINREFLKYSVSHVVLVNRRTFIGLQV